MGHKGQAAAGHNLTELPEFILVRVSVTSQEKVRID